MAQIVTGEDGFAVAGEDGVLLAGDERTQNDDIELFNFSMNLMQAILWQYQNAPNLYDLVEQKQGWYNLNQTQFWNDWIRDVFDLQTANEFGLSVWAVILQLPLFVNTPPYPDKPTFGFDLEEYGNFDNSNFTDTDGSSWNMPTYIKRLALKFRYYQLVSSGTVPEINRFLAFLFGSGNAWLLDNHDMTQTYIFNFPVPAEMAYLLNNFDILARPGTVGSNWIDATLQYFGFDPNLNFDNGILGG